MAYSKTYLEKSQLLSAILQQKKDTYQESSSTLDVSQSYGDVYKHDNVAN